MKLVKLWKQYDRPTDSEALLRLLNVAGFTKDQMAEFGNKYDMYDAAADQDESPEEAEADQEEAADGIDNRVQAQMNDTMTAAVKTNDYDKIQDLLKALQALDAKGENTESNLEMVAQVIERMKGSPADKKEAEAALDKVEAGTDNEDPATDAAVAKKKEEPKAEPEQGVSVSKELNPDGSEKKSEEQQ